MMLIQFAQYASLNPACMSELNVDNALGVLGAAGSLGRLSPPPLPGG